MAKQPTSHQFIHKLNKNPSPVELEVAQICSEIAESSTNPESKAAVATMKIVKVKEVDVPETGKKALVVFVPYVVYKNTVRPQQQRIINELEKKTKKHVCLMTIRSIMKPNTSRAGLKVRPRSRTLTAVHDAMLTDLVAPTEIVGRRTRVAVDGHKLYKVYLDPKDRTKESLEEKLPTFGAVYQALTCKETVFDFPEYTL
eukprot:Blabericola_migrator_1__9859@NODE_542_length_7732_cov_201_153033_g409_i0_p5_GENE_NODE_542_length_7732_cov_201_153033_g409_i0NODE_542_length_7732_cov_201_153033_g409_i0_p5_ORF_typecomplete_len200_score43_15Ribosomal_S7e/PF01251_18/8_5e55_NODE_542_length_7732_cov_201_153033_g409_i025603159